VLEIYKAEGCKYIVCIEAFTDVLSESNLFWIFHKTDRSLQFPKPSFVEAHTYHERSFCINILNFLTPLTTYSLILINCLAGHKRYCSSWIQGFCEIHQCTEMKQNMQKKTNTKIIQSSLIYHRVSDVYPPLYLWSYQKVLECDLL